MKIEQLIVQHLFRNKKLSLQDIGTFYLSADIALPAENDKENVLPENAVRFEFDKKAPIDEELIAFIVEKTRKIKPLATSDLESYCILARQFLNIGKPFSIEGLGNLQKNQSGIYEYVPDSQLHTPAEIQGPSNIREKADEAIDFSVTSTPAPSKTKWGWIGFFFFILAVAASVYFYFQNQNKSNNLEKLVPVKDTGADEIQVSDSLIFKDTTSLLPQPPQISRDTIRSNADSLKIVFKTYPNADAANLALKKYISFGHKANLRMADSTHYELYLTMPKMGTDTTKAIDSLRRFFGGNPYIHP